MNTIYKYSFQTTDSLEIEMPSNSEVLTVQIQYGIPTMWALVDTESKIVKKKFRICGTGHKITKEDLERFLYVGTYQLSEGRLVFHLFEILP